MRSLRILLIPALAAGLGACEPNEGAQEAADPGQVDSVVSVLGEGQTREVTFTPLAGSSVAGTALLQASGDRTRIQVELNGGQGVGTYAGHVHRGTSCDNLGEVVAPLQPVATNDQGQGAASSTVEQRMGDLLDGKYLIAFHQAGGQPVTCAVLPETRSPF